MHAHAISIPDTELQAPTPPVAERRHARRILVAEDDVAMRRLMAAALRTAGHRVIEASDGVDVLDRIESTIWADRQDAIGLIVCDMAMPALSGLDVLAALRSAEVRTPFILITAFGDDLVRAEAKALGASTVLDKPLDLQQLRNAVEAALCERDDSDVEVRARRRRPRGAPSVH